MNMIIYLNSNKIKKQLLLGMLIFTKIFLYSQVNNTARINPFLNLSQEEKDLRLANICKENKRDKKSETTVKMLLEAGANPNANPFDKSGETIFINDLFENNGVYTELFLNTGMSPDVSYSNQTVLFHITIKKDRFDSIKQLIDHGANVNIVDDEKNTIIYNMINNNYKIDEIEYVLQKGAPAFNKKKEKCHESIILATENGNLEIVKLLEKYGASLKINNDINYQSAISAATNSGNLEMVKYCFEKGCKISDIPETEYSPLLHCFGYDYFDIAEYLVSKGLDVNKPFIEEGTKFYILHWVLLKPQYTQRSQNKSIDFLLKHNAIPYLKIEKYGDAFDIAVKIINQEKNNPYDKSFMIDVYFLSQIQKYLDSKKHTTTIEEACIICNPEKLKPLLTDYKKSDDSMILFEYLTISTSPDRYKCLNLLSNAGIKPDYDFLSYCFIYNDQDFTKYLIKNYISIKNGDGKYKHDFLSFLCDTDNQLLNSSRLTKNVEFLFECLFDNGFTVKDKIYTSDCPDGENSLVYFFFTNPTTYQSLIIKILLQHGADIHQLYKGKPLLDYVREGSSLYYYLQDQGIIK